MRGIAGMSSSGEPSLAFSAALAAQRAARFLSRLLDPPNENADFSIQPQPGVSMTKRSILMASVSGSPSQGQMRTFVAPMSPFQSTKVLSKSAQPTMFSDCMASEATPRTRA